MKTNIIRIGNSQGIRIPRTLLEQSRLGQEVELEVENDRIIIRPAVHLREGWAEKFQAMVENGDDRMIDDLEETQWDREGWEW